MLKPFSLYPFWYNSNGFYYNFTDIHLHPKLKGSRTIVLELYIKLTDCCIGFKIGMDPFIRYIQVIRNVANILFRLLGYSDLHLSWYPVHVLLLPNQVSTVFPSHILGILLQLLSEPLKHACIMFDRMTRRWMWPSKLARLTVMSQSQRSSWKKHVSLTFSSVRVAQCQSVVTVC